MQKGIGVIIENGNGEFLVVKEKETKESYSKFKGDLSFPFGKRGDDVENEDAVDALYREVLEETGLDLRENKYLPCEFGEMVITDIDLIILFDVKLFHVKLNGVLKKYEEKMLKDEVENAFFISKEDFEQKIKKGGIRAGADVFYKFYKDILDIENAEYWGDEQIKNILLKNRYSQKNIVIAGPGSRYNLKKEGK